MDNVDAMNAARLLRDFCSSKTVEECDKCIFSRGEDCLISVDDEIPELWNLDDKETKS